MGQLTATHAPPLASHGGNVQAGTTRTNPGSVVRKWGRAVYRHATDCDMRRPWRRTAAMCKLELPGLTRGVWFGLINIFFRHDVQDACVQGKYAKSCAVIAPNIFIILAPVTII